MFDTEVEIELNTLTPKRFEFDLYNKNDRIKIMEFLNGEIKTNNTIIPYSYNEDNCVLLTEKLADYLKHKGSRRSIEDFRKVVNKSKNKKLKSKMNELDKVIDFMDSDSLNYTRYNQDLNRYKKKGEITKYNSNISLLSSPANGINTNSSILDENNLERFNEEKRINDSIYFNKIIKQVVAKCGFTESTLPQNLFYSAATIGLITEQLLINLKKIFEKGDGELLNDYIIKLSNDIVQEVEKSNFNDSEKHIIENIKIKASEYLDNYLDERVKLFLKYFDILTEEERIDIFETLALIRYKKITELDIKINSIITEGEINRAKNPKEREKLIELDKKTKNFKFVPSFTPMSMGTIHIIGYSKLIRKEENLNKLINHIIEKIERNFNIIFNKNPEYNIIEDLSTMDYIDNKEEFKEKLVKLAPLSNWRFFIDSEFYKFIKQPFMLENLGISILVKIAEKLKEIDEIEYSSKNNKIEELPNTLEITENTGIKTNTNEICELVIFEKFLSNASNEIDSINILGNIKKSKSLDFF